jgi:hypothetical protein
MSAAPHDDFSPCPRGTEKGVVRIERVRNRTTVSECALHKSLGGVYEIKVGFHFLA